MKKIFVTIAGLMIIFLTCGCAEKNNTDLLSSDLQTSSVDEWDESSEELTNESSEGVEVSSEFKEDEESEESSKFEENSSMIDSEISDDNDASSNEKPSESVESSEKWTGNH